MAEVSFEVEEQAAAEILNIGGDNNVYMGERRRGAGLGRAIALIGLIASLTGLALLVVGGVETYNALSPSDWSNWRSDAAEGWLVAGAIAIVAGIAVGKAGKVMAGR
jgi:hypothetical protein